MKKLLSLILITMLLLCAACGSVAEPAAGSAVESAAAERDSASEEPASEESAAEANWAATLNLKINPEFELQLDAGGGVISVRALNDDAASLLETGTIAWQDDAGDLRPLDGVAEDILRAADNGGFLASDAEIHLTVTALEGSQSFGDAALSAFTDAVNAYAAEAGYSLAPVTDYAAEVEFLSEEEFGAPGGEEETICPTCGGDGHIECPDCAATGACVCEDCGGTGTLTRTEIYEKQVRNSYVCPYCGGTGVLDDGMHGGETAECGFCTTNGGSGEWSALAYDTVQYEEIITETCPRCEGSGSYACPQCEGAVIIDCPTCGGSGVLN